MSSFQLYSQRVISEGVVYIAYLQNMSSSKSINPPCFNQVFHCKNDCVSGQRFECKECKNLNYPDAIFCGHKCYKDFESCHNYYHTLKYASLQYSCHKQNVSLIFFHPQSGHPVTIPAKARIAFGYTTGCKSRYSSLGGSSKSIRFVLQTGSYLRIHPIRYTSSICLSALDLWRYTAAFTTDFPVSQTKAKNMCYNCATSFATPKFRKRCFQCWCVHECYYVSFILSVGCTDVPALQQLDKTTTLSSMLDYCLSTAIDIRMQIGAHLDEKFKPKLKFSYCVTMNPTNGTKLRNTLLHAIAVVAITLLSFSFVVLNFHHIALSRQVRTTPV